MSPSRQVAMRADSAAAGDGRQDHCEGAAQRRQRQEEHPEVLVAGGGQAIAGARRQGDGRRACRRAAGLRTGLRW